jgi:hypothetical protein
MPVMIGLGYYKNIFNAALEKPSTCVMHGFNRRIFTILSLFYCEISEHLLNKEDLKLIRTFFDRIFGAFMLKVEIRGEENGGKTRKGEITWLTLR